MKLAKLVLPLILPVAVMFMTTGCPKHNTIPVTKINKHVVSPNTPQPEPSLDMKPLVQQEQPLVSTPTPPPYTGGPIGTTTNWDLKDYTIDKSKLESYTVHFKYDSAVVEDGEQTNVTSVADALKTDANARLLIEGHCDERGTEQYNMSLGERRALALREALAKVGVDAGRIRTISYGKDQPVDPAHDESAWTKNRRGQFDWCTPKNAAP